MTFSEIFSRQEQQRVDEEYRGDYRNYKNKQNNLPDSQRRKVFSSNEYWLVNKEQDLWLGLFDGKNIKVPANYLYVFSWFIFLSIYQKIIMFSGLSYCWCRYS